VVRTTLTAPVPTLSTDQLELGGFGSTELPKLPNSNLAVPAVAMNGRSRSQGS